MNFDYDLKSNLVAMISNHSQSKNKLQLDLRIELELCLLIQREMRVTPLGFCLRVILNENPLNFEKTTSIVLSVLLLIYDENLKIECAD